MTLTVERLSAGFPERPVLHDVGFALAPGERVAVIGPNGAGKSTLVKCLAGLLRPDAGEILLDGRPLGTFTQRERARRIAYVPQPTDGGLPFRVRDFVLMGRYPHAIPLSGPSAADSAAVDRALALTGTECFADRVHRTLSGGERQKVMLAAALAQEADLLLLDEPTAFLDPGHQQEIDAILAAVHRDHGTTILSVTHDLNRAALSHRRILALRDGRIVADGPPAEVYTQETLAALYGPDRFIMVPHPTADVPMLLPR